MAQVVSRGQVTGPRRLGLPAEATSFTGRATELAGITALLRTARLVTVTGAAGVGKTRTSLAAASMAASEYPDGAWFCDLGAITDPGLLTAAAGAALGVPDGGASAQAALLGQLRGRRLLLVLDTCEHLVDACAEFAGALLRAAPGVTLLATSRQPLDAPGEHAFPLLPLPAESAAAELFAQRARAVVPGFAVTPENRADVVRLCQLLDGNPLAIEFAAVRLRALPLADLARQLEAGGAALRLSRRGTSPRHQTLRAAVDWSYRLCDPAEQALWQRLSVFSGTFDVAGAELVCAGGVLPRKQVLHALVGLVDKSVVRRDGAESPRYRLPGAARGFGAGQLAQAGGQEHLMARLAAWSLTLARDFDELSGSVQVGSGIPVGWGDPAADVSGAAGGQLRAALRRLHSEHENIEAALCWALRAEDGPDAPASRGADGQTARWGLGADLAVRLRSYWHVSGQLDDGRRWLDRVVDLFPAPASERGLALGARGQLAALQGDLAGALSDISESVQLAEAAAQAAGRDADPAVARGYLRLNLALTLAGRYAQALAAGETARQRLTRCGLQAGLAALEAQLAVLHQLAGNVDQAIACCDRGLAVLGGSPVPRDPSPGGSDGTAWLGGYLRLIGGLALFQRPGDEQACGSALRAALAAWGERGDVMGTAYAVEALGWLAARQEQYERAAWLLGGADELWARTGRRLSGIALMEEHREQAVLATRRSLGERRYGVAYAHGAALGFETLVKDAAEAPGDPAARAGDLAAGLALPGPAVALLTRREREIADLVASGLSNREIGERLFISKRTVDAHVDHIFGKLELSSRVQLTVLLREQAPRDHASRS